MATDEELIKKYVEENGTSKIIKTYSVLEAELDLTQAPKWLIYLLGTYHKKK